MTERINDIVTISYGANPTVDWTPKGPTFSYSTGLATHTHPDLFYTPAGEPVTFTGNVTYSDSRYATVWEWTMGDNTTLYGKTITHTYRTANPLAQVSLRVLDNFGNSSFVRKQIYLKTLYHVVANPAITAVKV